MRKMVWVLTVLLCATSAWAQFDTGTVLGTIRDASGAVVTGATVTLTNVATGITATALTDDLGSYVFPSVKIGNYKITGEHSGFASGGSAEFKLDVNNRQRVDLEMAVGAISETVEVTSFAPLVETDSSQRGQVISNLQATQLPLNGREYSSLSLLTTGVRLSSIGTGSNLNPREGSFNVNGLRSTFNNFLLDGVDNNAYGTSNQGFSNQVMQPPPDAVAEFKVVTNNMSAEYGRSAGATINVAYASGTNDFHLSLWEFVRNTSLNAVGFFRPRVGNTLPFHRNQFGGTFGGPLVKNRAFFFLDYEGFRQIRDFVSFTTIPTLDQRQGILPVAVTNPLTGKTYPAGTAIPAADIQPFARKVLADLPAPTGSAAANNYQILQGFKNFNDKFDAKFDFQIGTSSTGFVRIGQRKANLFDQPPIPLPSGGSGNSATRALNQQLTSGLTYTSSPTQIWEFRLGISKTKGGKNPAALGTPNALDAYGIPGLPTDPRISGGLPAQLISGYSDLGRQATNPQWQYPTVFNPKLNYTKVYGPHTVKAGYEFQHIRTEVQDVNPLYGRDTYAGRYSGDNFADFLFGLRSQYALSNIFVANLRQNMHFMYLQDDYHASSKLTLNIGARYEYASPHTERDNNLTNFDPVTRTMIKATAGSISDRALVHPDRNNWAPRLGLAYSFTPETVLRGGIGVSYIHFNRSGAANLLPINGPQVVNAVVNQRPTDTTFLTTQQGYPSDLASPSKFDPLQANITYMPQDTRTGYVTSWFFSGQRQIGKATLIDAAYVGNKGNKLLIFANYNQAVPNQTGQNLSLQQRRPIAAFSDITLASNSGFSTYNSLQLRFEQRFTGGLFLLNSFTWSKSMDNGAGSLENPNGNFPAPQDYYNRKAEKGLSAYDQPITNMTSLVYRLPFAKDKPYGGWEISAINTMRSGEPLTFIYTPAAALVVSGIAQDFRGANNYRPDIVGDPILPKSQRTIANYFNKDAVVIPTGPSPFGSAGRNTARSDSFYQLDMALVKHIAIREKASMQFRAEAFNLLNKTNFVAPTTNRSSAAFGTITATFDPRLIQLGLKLIF